MHAKTNPDDAAADRLSAMPPTGNRAAEALSAHARRQVADAASPTRAGDVVTWREELDIRTEAHKTSATVQVHTYVTEEKVSRQIALMHEEASVTTQRITPSEAAGLVPREIRGDRDETFEFELSTQEAVVSKRLVPNERVTVDIRRVTEMVTVDDTVKTEQVRIDPPPHPPKTLRVRREGVTNA